MIVSLKVCLWPYGVRIQAMLLLCGLVQPSCSAAGDHVIGVQDLMAQIVCFSTTVHTSMLSMLCCFSGFCAMHRLMLLLMRTTKLW